MALHTQPLVPLSPVVRSLHSLPLVGSWGLFDSYRVSIVSVARLNPFSRPLAGQLVSIHALDREEHGSFFGARLVEHIFCGEAVASSDLIVDRALDLIKTALLGICVEYVYHVPISLVYQNFFRVIFQPFHKKHASVHNRSPGNFGFSSVLLRVLLGRNFLS